MCIDLLLKGCATGFRSDYEGLQDKVNEIKLKLLPASERLREVRGETASSAAPSTPETAEATKE